VRTTTVSGVVEVEWAAAGSIVETAGDAGPAGLKGLSAEEVIAGEPAAAVGGVVITVDPR
jgi:hypothetical protein